MRFCRLTKIAVAPSPSTSCRLRSTETCDVWSSLRRRVFLEIWHPGSSRQWKLIVRLMMRPWSVWAAHVLQEVENGEISRDEGKQGAKVVWYAPRKAFKALDANHKALRDSNLFVFYMFLRMFLLSTLDLCDFHVRSPWQRQGWSELSRVFGCHGCLASAFWCIFDSLFGELFIFKKCGDPKPGRHKVASRISLHDHLLKAWWCYLSMWQRVGENGEVKKSKL